RLLWVKGNPGKGKTILLCGIIDKLNTRSAEASVLLLLPSHQQATQLRHSRTAQLNLYASRPRPVPRFAYKEEIQ
ncbi:hypothetical protein LZ30DRAFT_807407, partial [Colletotrichum cereale]